MKTPEFRMTHQRKVILGELKKSHLHPTADDIYVHVRKILPRISLGTVYRNCEILSEMGLIKKIEGCGNQRRFDGNIGNHHHIRCIKCGRVDDLPQDTISGIDINYEKINGYIVTDHTLSFQGICRECQTKH